MTYCVITFCLICREYYDNLSKTVAFCQKPRYTSCCKVNCTAKIYLFVPWLVKIMRHEMETVVKEAFRETVLKMRGEYGLTQAKMAEALVMSERSYESIESGHSSCGILTVILVLIKLDNQNEFLDALREKLEQAYAIRIIMV